MTRLHRFRDICEIAGTGTRDRGESQLLLLLIIKLSDTPGDNYFRDNARIRASPGIRCCEFRTRGRPTQRRDRIAVNYTRLFIAYANMQASLRRCIAPFEDRVENKGRRTLLHLFSLEPVLSNRSSLPMRTLATSRLPEARECKFPRLSNGMKKRPTR